MGGVVPGGFTRRRRTSTRTASCSRRARSTRRGKPVQETWTLIFDNARFGELLFPDMQTICANLDLGERLLVGDRRALRRRGRARRDDATSATRPRSAMTARARGDPGRRLGGRGLSWTPTALDDCRGLPRPRPGRRSAGERAEVDFSRQLAPGPHVGQRDVAGREDRRRRRVQVPARPARAVHVGPHAADRHRAARGHGHQRACRPTGRSSCTSRRRRSLTSALLRALGQAVGRARDRRRRRLATSTTPAACTPNGTPWQSARPGAAASRAVGRHAATATPTRSTLTYQANGIATAVEAVEFDVPVVILRREIVPDTRRAGRPPRRRGVVTDYALARPRRALPDVAAPPRAERQRRRTAAPTGTTGGVWFWEGDERGGFTGRSRRLGRVRRRAAGRRPARPGDERAVARGRVRVVRPPVGVAHAAATRRCATSPTAAAAGATR